MLPNRPGLPPSGQNSAENLRIPPRRRPKDYSPEDWATYWTEKKSFEQNEDLFNYFTMGDPEADCYILLLHGGGFSAFGQKFLKNSVFK